MSRTMRKKLTKGKSVDSSCGNNKGCPVCEGNRLHKHNKRKVNDGTITDYGTKVSHRIEEKRIEQ